MTTPSQYIGQTSSSWYQLDRMRLAGSTSPSPVPTGIFFCRASIEGSANVAFYQVNLVNDHFHGIGSRGLCPDLVNFWAAVPDTSFLMGSDDSWSSLRGAETSFAISLQISTAFNRLAFVTRTPTVAFRSPWINLSGGEGIPNQVKRQEQAFDWIVCESFWSDVVSTVVTKTDEE
ncbi:hypothetical protein TRIATDRAFT_87116 [Trichoderma atroviride IMI 206040]|uniref:Uncharacterized protein n=1 Tax=Hypocrea atroviridis (strain ATCC 20476 / IMI 206040) TaxID=452589 RepID=G9NZZ2_HYPAI|nr:uncharacterized protein TRIATDRAFT_87116 [Trichoderma atroviride IMI 206040]EHK44039.1 hypothetical protein TRIATDRAFT_87116 [Trichoderma atroviride IMI 206040]